MGWLKPGRKRAVLCWRAVEASSELLRVGHHSAFENSRLAGFPYIYRIAATGRHRSHFAAGTMCTAAELPPGPPARTIRLHGAFCRLFDGSACLTLLSLSLAPSRKVALVLARCLRKLFILFGLVVPLLTWWTQGNGKETRPPPEGLVSEPPKAT